MLLMPIIKKHIDVPSEETDSNADASVENRLEQISNFSTSQLKA